MKEAIESIKIMAVLAIAMIFITIAIPLVPIRIIWNIAGDIAKWIDKNV